jgi:hypothetical protein
MPAWPSNVLQPYLYPLLDVCILSARQTRAPHDGGAVANELLDQRKLVVVNQRQQILLQVPLTFRGLQPSENRVSASGNSPFSQFRTLKGGALNLRALSQLLLP